MNVKAELKKQQTVEKDLRFNDLELAPETIQAIMINEVVPADPKDDFYGGGDAAYLETTIPLFQNAGIQAGKIADLLEMGIYMTNAVKVPKEGYTIDKASIEMSLPFLEKELTLFPNVKVIMLMGDVAKKAFNMITKKETKKNVIPSIPTYKIRENEFYYGKIRVMPSYIMTGKNILIEKSKFNMATEDIANMIKIIS